MTFVLEEACLEPMTCHLPHPAPPSTITPNPNPCPTRDKVIAGDPSLRPGPACARPLRRQAALARSTMLAASTAAPASVGSSLARAAGWGTAASDLRTAGSFGVRPRGRRPQP